MDLIKQYNSKLEPMKAITGVAMKVHAKYRSGLLESAYEAAMEYLLKKDGHKVERQKMLPIFWDDVQLDQTYRMDLVVNENIILELKAIPHAGEEHRRQLWNYMNLTHMPYGMLINFGGKHLFSEWFKRYSDGKIEKVRLF